MLSVLDDPVRWNAVLGFDFDDTLLMKGGEGVVGAFFEKIRIVRSDYGAAWGIATGRSLPHLVEGMTRERFPFLPDFVVAREREIFFPGQFGRWVPHDEWNRNCEKSLGRLFRKNKRVLKRVRKFVEEETGGEWVSQEGDAAGIVTRTEEEMDRVVVLIDELGAGGDLTYERNSIYLRFSHRGFSKGTGLLEAAGRWGIGRDRILAVGDNYNDFSMLAEEVSFGCGCPANAVREVREFVSKRGGVVARESASAGVVEVLDSYFE